MKPARVRLTIDRFVLRGIPREQRDALIAAFKTELSRLLEDPASAAGILSKASDDWNRASVRGGQLRTAADSRPGNLGQQAAQRVVACLEVPR